MGYYWNGSMYVSDSAGSTVTQGTGGTSAWLVSDLIPTIATRRPAVVANTSVVTLMPALGTTKRVRIFNESTSNLRVIEGTGGSLSDYSYVVGPFVVFDVIIADIIQGVWEGTTPTGQARITVWSNT